MPYFVPRIHDMQRTKRPCRVRYQQDVDVLGGRDKSCLVFGPRDAHADSRLRTRQRVAKNWASSLWHEQSGAVQREASSSATSAALEHARSARSRVRAAHNACVRGRLSRCGSLSLWQLDADCALRVAKRQPVRL
eukprot:6189961-Pleurochrysis_carterae.AAC.1